MSSQDNAHDDRLIRVETLLMHLQRDVEQLSKAVLAQQGEVDELKRLLAQLASAIESDVVEPRPPEEERPPHY